MHCIDFNCENRYLLGTNRTQTRKADVHPVPDSRAREGVSLQSLLDPSAKDRDRPRPVPHGAPDKDLVPESAHEVEEGEQDEGRAGIRRRRRRDNTTQQSAVGSTESTHLNEISI